jgi:AraC-like DNA-binding protein
VVVSRSGRVDRTGASDRALRGGEQPLRSHPEGYLRERTADAGEAEEIISRHYLGNRLHFPRSRTLEMDFAALRIGGITSGRLSYGQRIRQQTEEAVDFHVNMPVRGNAVSRRGHGEPVRTAAGQGLVFSPEAPAEIVWSPDCIQLCLMIPRAGLEAELERLLGRSIHSRLCFDFGVAPERVAGRLHTVLDLVAQELDEPSGLAGSQVAGGHLQGLVLDGLLLEQPHNYSEAAGGSQRLAPSAVIRRAVQLIEERPGEPWTTVGLATKLHLSVRALQSGFKRELGMAPMMHLRLVRLRRAHAALRDADPTETTVRAVAVNLGLLHQGRFALSYRAAFGESPSETLRR